MAGTKAESSPEVRRWLGNLLVAWTVVTGLSATFASAWYYRTGDIKIMLAYVGAPFLIGAVLFLGLGIMALASRSRATVGERDMNRKLRKDIFGR